VAALDELLARIDDVSLRAAIEQELAPLRAERELGLVFEKHLPEKVRLPGLAVRRGTTVEVRADRASPTWQVVGLSSGRAVLTRRVEGGATLSETHPVEDLIVVREFGHAIHPGLRSVGRVERGGDKPFHTVINAENYHALETLLYTCEGTVDVIYIDPPYNTGARDWKYNNDYVDGNDGYRHSKWLSFMEKRLRLAKRLLNPTASALIVTIDEKEYLRLGLLLQQIFPGSTMQMVSSQINPKGTGRTNELRRIDEYIYLLWFGEAMLGRVPSLSGIQDGPSADVGEAVAGSGNIRGLDWQTARRRDLSSVRPTRPAQFYPIYVNTTTGLIEEVGDPIGHDVDRNDAPQRDGCAAVFPIRPDGTEMNWGVTQPTFFERWKAGYARAGKARPGEPQQYIIQYLKSGPIADIQTGKVTITGRNPDGSVIGHYGDPQTKVPTTQWVLKSHNAEHYGTGLVKTLLPGRVFPFPKSLYAVEDALCLFVKDNTDALIFDFFGGSGTTTHAVMRLNHQDGGRRRSILVTNNEIGPDAERELTAQRLGPGDPKWDERGIFEYVTRPRIEAAVTGVTHAGDPVTGSYKFVDEFPMSEGFEENVEFFTLTYEDPDRVRLGAAFEAVAPLLWLMAGASGPRVDEVSGPWSLPEGGRYGVLFDADQWPGFVEAVRKSKCLTHAFVVTDSDAVFQRVVAELPDTVAPVRLYESYLRSFAINTGAGR
jgi:adenine-specific DNA-methyltransferase